MTSLPSSAMEAFDFTVSVLEKSNSTPVVVDFWAPWCGPCQFLGPAIEELANKANGKWELVKVNTDDYPDLMAEYKIRGIPAVKMFYQEEVIAEFVGALPKFQIEKWLDEHLPDELKKELLKIEEHLKTSQNGSALSELRKFVESYPEMEEAKVLLAKNIVFDDPIEAKTLTAHIKIGSKLFTQVEDIQNFASLFECHGDSAKIEDILSAARSAIKEHNLEEALERLIEAVVIDKGYCEELPRKATVALFRILGDQHELTKQYRRKFDMSLY